MFFELKVIKNEFPRLAVQVPVVAERTAGKYARLVAEGARERSRVRTGEMAGGWQAEGFEVSDAVYYTRFHEHGTVFMSAQPMLHPSIEAESEPFFAELAVALWA